MVELLEVDDEHAEAVGDAAPHHRDDEHTHTDEPALAVSVDHWLDEVPLHAHASPHLGCFLKRSVTKLHRDVVDQEEFEQELDKQLIRRVFG